MGSDTTQTRLGLVDGFIPPEGTSDPHDGSDWVQYAEIETGIEQARGLVELAIEVRRIESHTPMLPKHRNFAELSGLIQNASRSPIIFEPGTRISRKSHLVKNQDDLNLVCAEYMKENCGELVFTLQEETRHLGTGIDSVRDVFEQTTITVGEMKDGELSNVTVEDLTQLALLINEARYDGVNLRTHMGRIADDTKTLAIGTDFLLSYLAHDNPPLTKIYKRLAVAPVAERKQLIIDLVLPILRDLNPEEYSKIDRLVAFLGDTPMKDLSSSYNDCVLAWGEVSTELAHLLEEKARLLVFESFAKLKNLHAANLQRVGDIALSETIGSNPEFQTQIQKLVGLARLLKMMGSKKHSGYLSADDEKFLYDATNQKARTNRPERAVPEPDTKIERSPSVLGNVRSAYYVGDFVFRGGVKFARQVGEIRGDTVCRNLYDRLRKIVDLPELGLIMSAVYGDFDELTRGLEDVRGITETDLKNISDRSVQILIANIRRFDFTQTCDKLVSRMRHPSLRQTFYSCLSEAQLKAVINRLEVFVNDNAQSET